MVSPDAGRWDATKYIHPITRERWEKQAVIKVDIDHILFAHSWEVHLEVPKPPTGDGFGGKITIHI